MVCTQEREDDKSNKKERARSIRRAKIARREQGSELGFKNPSSSHLEQTGWTRETGSRVGHSELVEWALLFLNSTGDTSVDMPSIGTGSHEPRERETSLGSDIPTQMSFARLHLTNE